MLNIPYEQQKDPKACALACYTMVTKYFFKDVVFDDVAKISEWEPGYVAWAFKFWLWIMDKGVVIENYDLIDYDSWANIGSEALRQSSGEKEYEYYKSNTKNLDAYTADIAKLMKHPNFHYHRQKPTLEDLKKSLYEGHVCEVTINSRSGNGFALHRVVVLDVDDIKVTFHDPSVNAGPNMKIKIEKFAKAWLVDVSEPELCIYKKV